MSPIDFFALPVVCQPNALLGLFAAVEIHSRHVEGVREKTHVEGVSSYACMGALSTSIQGQRSAV